MSLGGTALDITVSLPDEKINILSPVIDTNSYNICVHPLLCIYSVLRGKFNHATKKIDNI